MLQIPQDVVGVVQGHETNNAINAVAGQRQSLLIGDGGSQCCCQMKYVVQDNSL